MFWWGFLCGSFTGTLLGVFIMCLMHCASEGGSSR
jgi:hypothetical protein